MKIRVSGWVNMDSEQLAPEKQIPDPDDRLTGQCRATLYRALGDALAVGPDGVPNTKFLLNPEQWDCSLTPTWPKG